MFSPEWLEHAPCLPPEWLYIPSKHWTTYPLVDCQKDGMQLKGPPSKLQKFEGGPGELMRLPPGQSV
jgi:hypothetical protein